MNISVLTPDKEIFDGTISSVIVPGTNGMFQILENHAAIVSSLGSGQVSITKTDGQKMNFTITKGFIEVSNNVIALLVQGVEGA